MNRAEIANLEHASRAAMAWIPEGADDNSHSRSLIAAVVPAIGILAVAAMLLLAVL